MSLAKSLEKHLAGKSNLCTVGNLIKDLSEEDHKTFTEALDNNYPTHSLVRALREIGYKMSDNSLNAHRQGKCKCVNA